MEGLVDSYAINMTHSVNIMAKDLSYNDQRPSDVSNQSGLRISKPGCLFSQTKEIIPSRKMLEGKVNSDRRMRLSVFKYANDQNLIVEGPVFQGRASMPFDMGKSIK